MIRRKSRDEFLKSHAALRVLAGCAIAALLILSAVRLHAALPAAAQEPFDKGMSAAKQQDFPLAIRYFTDARKAAPDSTSVLFNLALAEAQVPGRELRAVCWFETYLALTPDADNAAAIRKQIDDLEIRAEGNVSKIVEVMKTLAGKFPAGDNSGLSAMIQIASVQAESGDMDGANATLGSLPYDSRDNARGSVASWLAQSGRFDDAKTMASSIAYDQPNKTPRSSAFQWIANSQISQGLFADARQSLASVADPYQHIQLIQNLATVLFDKGNQDDAMALLAEAKQVAANPGSDASTTTLLLRTLAATEARLGLQAEALATLKKSDAKLPAKASSSNNYDIYNSFTAHLQAFDYAGARALIPHLIDQPGFKYKTEAIRSVSDAITQDVVNQYYKINSLDLPHLETALSRPSMDPVVRIWGYSALARLCKNGGHPEKLPDIFQKAVATFASVGDYPPARPTASNWIADIAALASMPAETQAWRLKAVLSLDPLIKNGAQKIDNLSAMYVAQTYAVAAEEIIENALSSSDDKTLHTALDAAGRDLPKCDEFRQYLLAAAVLHHYWAAGNFDAAAAFIKSVPNEKLRQEAMNIQLQFQFQKLLAMVKLPEAARALGQITDIPSGNYTLYFGKPSIPSLQYSLANAYTDAGDWDNAEKTAAAISDAGSRKNAMNYLAYARAQGGVVNSKQSTADAAARWHEQLASLSTQTQPADQLNTYWQLCGFVNQDLLEEQRKLMPAYFSAAIAVAKPDERSGFLNYNASAAQSLGLFEMERHAQASGLSAVQAESSSYWSSGFLGRGSVADYLEQSSIRRHDEILIMAIDRLVADGNPAAGVKIVDQLANTDDSIRNRILMNLWIAQGKPAEARAAFDKIQKDSPQNGQVKSVACQDLVNACIKAGDVASAKSAVEENRKLMDNDTLVSRAIMAIALAGEPDWAVEQAKSIAYDSTRNETLATIAGMQAAHNQDAAAVKALLKTSQAPVLFIDAMINAGNPQLALQLIPEIPDFTQQQNETASAATALARSGDAASAKKAAETIAGNPQRFSARCQIAYEQAKGGDLDGARATLIEARKLDARTSKDFDMDAWVNSQIFYFVEGKGDFAAAQSLLQKIQDPALHDGLSRTVAYNAIQKKDFATVQSTLAAITDPATRTSLAISLCNSTNDPAEILTLSDQMNDPGYQAVTLNLALNKAISLGDLSPVLPRVLALPDGAVKAYLLSDVLRAQVYLGLDTGNTSVLPLAVKALAAMPQDVWHTLLMCDLVRLAQQGSPSQAEILKGHAATEAQALEGADAKIWQQFLADASAAKVEEQKAASTPAATASGGYVEPPATAWVNYSESYLKDPLSTDFKSALEGAASSTADNSSNKAWTVFTNVSQLAEQLLRKLKDIHDLRAKLSAPAKL